MIRAIVITPKDNVATAIDDIGMGEKVDVRCCENIFEITAKQVIPFGHKFAIKKIRSGEYIIKYGEVIGIAVSDIDVGEHVHIHNVKSTRGEIGGKHDV